MYNHYLIVDRKGQRQSRVAPDAKESLARELHISHVKLETSLSTKIHCLISKSKKI